MSTLLTQCFFQFNRYWYDGLLPLRSFGPDPTRRDLKYEICRYEMTEKNQRTEKDVGPSEGRCDNGFIRKIWYSDLCRMESILGSYRGVVKIGF